MNFPDLRRILMLLVCLLVSLPTYSQHKATKQRKTKQKASYFNTPEDWYRKVKGKPFPLQELYNTTSGKTFDFGHLQHPTIVCFGFTACPPCRHELPVYIAAAASYPNVDFVYITYDAEETRIKELSEIGKDIVLPVNYYVIHMSQQDIDRKNLTLAYPTQYFVRQDGIVNYMNSGGDPDEPVADIQARIARIIAGGD